MSHPHALRRLLLSLLACIALTSAGCSEGMKALMEAAAEAADSDQAISVQITRFGIVDAELGDDVVEAPTTTTGALLDVVSTRYVANTNRIPATLGTSFGIDYAVWGAPRGTPVTLEMRTVHSLMTNPNTGRATTVSIWQWETQAGYRDGRIYTLEYDWEVVPGDWSFEIYHEGKLVEKQDFILYDPDLE